LRGEKLSNNRKSGEARTTIGIRQSVKDRLDGNRAPGQCYDGFLCQLVDLWEANHGDGTAKTAKKDAR
jgi:hypothetical protein